MEAPSCSKRPFRALGNFQRTKDAAFPRNTMSSPVRKVATLYSSCLADAFLIATAKNCNRSSAELIACEASSHFEINVCSSLESWAIKSEGLADGNSASQSTKEIDKFSETIHS